jgi:hypothetical protein
MRPRPYFFLRHYSSFDYVYIWSSFKIKKKSLKRTLVFSTTVDHRQLGFFFFFEFN